ncbi:hypothetical protein [Shewanella algae]|uniref:hypothetical protein n=1 Tax=Shewanella algae TaxID=38313 RepID=UPI001181D870|nr:hypothetical protein [Shewanella algae]MDV2962551.1 hypothetical protein [Shewanella algae]QHD51878.1 hypothetical protein GM320_01140 [Shewanella algae]TVL36870.1 hypothetical protein AYI94_12865 [Shewanella algae]
MKYLLRNNFTVSEGFILFFFLGIFISEFFLGSGLELVSTKIKMLSYLMAISGIILYFLSGGRVDMMYTILILPTIFFLMLGFYNTHNINAAIEELSRYFFPFIYYLASLVVMRKSIFFRDVFLKVALLSIFYQCYFYLSVFLNLPSFHEPLYDNGLILRGQGLFGGVASFSFMNLVAFSLACHGRKDCCFFYRIRYLFAIFSVLAISFKLVPFVFVAMFVFSEHKKAYLLFFGAVSSIVFLYFFNEINLVYELLVKKINFYILVGNSARFESYRVMFELFYENLYIGQGLGTFGGVASTKYYSPLYLETNFNWYGLDEFGLKTTDTFYPHVFVELGFIGAIFYFLSLFYFIAVKVRRNAFKVYFVVVSAILFDSFFSFGIQTSIYMICVFFMLPLLGFNKIKRAVND